MIKETFTYSDFAIVRRVESRIRSNMMLEERAGIRCPHCNSVIKSNCKHGEPFFCPQCNMKITVYGNALECELEEE